MVTSDGLEELQTFSSKEIDRDTPIYNFALDGDHTYHANGYLVHNKSPFCSCVTESYGCEAHGGGSCNVNVTEQSG